MDNLNTHRRKSFTDGVVPSANSVGTLVLLTLNRMTGRLDYRRMAEQLIGLYPDNAGANAVSYSLFLAAADFAAGPSFEVVVAGDPSSADTREILRALHRGFFPNTLTSLRPRRGAATVSVCRDTMCSLPTTDVQVMLRQLR